jgi:hypothetical protein
MARILSDDDPLVVALPPQLKVSGVNTRDSAKAKKSTKSAAKAWCVKCGKRLKATFVHCTRCGVKLNPGINAPAEGITKMARMSKRDPVEARIQERVAQGDFVGAAVIANADGDKARAARLLALDMRQTANSGHLSHDMAEAARKVSGQ